MIWGPLLRFKGNQSDKVEQTLKASELIKKFKQLDKLIIPISFGQISLSMNSSDIKLIDKLLLLKLAN